MSRADARNFVIGEVSLECIQQDIKFGEQNLADGTGGQTWVDIANSCRRANDMTSAAGKSITWKMILTEEFAEAMAESDEALLRAELVQVAAVCVQWIASIDRRKAK